MQSMPHGQLDPVVFAHGRQMQVDLSVMAPVAGEPHPLIG